MLGLKDKKSKSLTRLGQATNLQERVKLTDLTLKSKGRGLSLARLGTPSTPSIGPRKAVDSLKAITLIGFQPKMVKNIANRGGKSREVIVSRLNTVISAPKRTSVEVKAKTPSHKTSTGGLSPGANAFFKTIRVKKKNDGSPPNKSRLDKFVTKVAEPGIEEPLASFRATQADVMRAALKPYFVEDLLRAHASDSPDYFDQIFRTHFAQTLQTLNLMLSIDLRHYRPNGVESSLPQSNENLLRPLRLAAQSPSISQKSRKALHPRAAHSLEKENPPRKKTLIFDLDETLIHCNEDQTGECDLRVPITFPSGEQILAGINVRPHATELLNEMAKFFEVIVFTASHSCYANPVIDRIDPNRVISHRLFRENCSVIAEGLYTKDLSIIKNRSLKDMILVDNANYSFFLQMSNGVPIIPFYNNKEDCELLKLKGLLLSLVDVDDVRPKISEYFSWAKFKKYSNDPFKLIQKILI